MYACAEEEATVPGFARVLDAANKLEPVSKSLEEDNQASELTKESSDHV
jgi:hypothetical protein